MGDNRITIEDARRAGYCVRGLKYWCVERGIDFKSFVKNGIDVDEIEGFKDAHIQRILAMKEGKMTWAAEERVAEPVLMSHNTTSPSTWEYAQDRWTQSRES